MQDILRRIAAPVDMTRTWIDAMDARRMHFGYEEIVGADHYSAITRGMPAVFEFLNATHA